MNKKYLFKLLGASLTSGILFSLLIVGVLFLNKVEIDLISILAITLMFSCLAFSKFIMLHIDKKEGENNELS